MDSCLAAWMKPQVLTTTTSASGRSVSTQPAVSNRAASSSESTSLRAQPRVTRRTVRSAAGGVTLFSGTPEDYGTCPPRSVRGHARSRAHVWSAGELLTRTEAQRDRVAHGARPATVLPVHGEHDRAGVAQLHVH